MKFTVFSNKRFRGVSHRIWAMVALEKFSFFIEVPHSLGKANVWSMFCQRLKCLDGREINKKLSKKLNVPYVMRGSMTGKRKHCYKIQPLFDEIRRFDIFQAIKILHRHIKHIQTYQEINRVKKRSWQIAFLLLHIVVFADHKVLGMGGSP